MQVLNEGQCAYLINSYVSGRLVSCNHAPLQVSLFEI